MGVAAVSFVEGWGELFWDKLGPFQKENVCSVSLFDFLSSFFLEVLSFLYMEVFWYCLMNYMVTYVLRNFSGNYIFILNFARDYNFEFAFD